MKWFGEGERNTKFFHSYMNGKRKRLNISELQTAQGDVITIRENVRAEAASFFEEQFRQENNENGYRCLDEIPKLTTEVKNEDMLKISNA